MIQGIAELFRDSDVLREHRDRARLKFLFPEAMAGPSSDFQTGIGISEIGLRSSIQRQGEAVPPMFFATTSGFHPQKQRGPVSTLSSRRYGSGFIREQMRRVGEFGRSLCRWRTSHDQHAEPPESSTCQRQIVQLLAKELESAPVTGLRLRPFWRGAIACSGQASSASWRSLRPRVFPAGWCRNWRTGFPGFDQDLKLHVTGCPNSCGQHWIADIGIEGKKLRVDGHMVDAYYFCLGGAVGLNQAIARLAGYRCVASDVPDAIERLLRAYLAGRLPGENLRRFFARHTETELRGFLAGESVAAVLRDTPPGPVPHGLEG